MWTKLGKTRSRRAQRKAEYPAKRKAAREGAYHRDGGRCVFPTCRRQVYLDTGHLMVLAHGHELVYRSQQGDPTDVNNVVTVCPSCHMEMHTPVGGKKKRIEGTTIGQLVFYEKDRHTGGWVEVGRG